MENRDGCPACSHIGGYANIPVEYKRDAPKPHPCCETHSDFPDKPKIKTLPDKRCLLQPEHERKKGACCAEYQDPSQAQNANQDATNKKPTAEGCRPTLSSLVQDFTISKLDMDDDLEISNPCYLPQHSDNLTEKNIPEPLGPIGPWATGRVDWGPLAGLTGTRPVVDHYSITRFSENEWRARNQDVIGEFTNTLQNSTKAFTDGRNTMLRTFALCDENQNDTTQKLIARFQEVNKWKDTLERTIKAMAEEISIMSEERNRLKKSLSVLKTPEAIATECLDLRCQRPESELVRDEAEEEIIKEVALIGEIRTVLNKTLVDFEAQQIVNRAARERLEWDWGAKKEAAEGEALNICLNNKSTIALFRPGATRMGAEQSSYEYWQHFSKESLDLCEETRIKSVNLRSTLNAVLNNAARDLRTQADVVERALTTRIGCQEQLRIRLEKDLHALLARLADTEQLIDKLSTGMRNMDNCMKVAQTRLHNRNQRTHVENCRDPPQVSLIEGVRTIQSGVTAMLGTLDQAEKTKQTLMETRVKLEREIMLKRRTIMIDRDRCMKLRSHYPTAAALTGFK